MFFLWTLRNVGNICVFRIKARRARWSPRKFGECTRNIPRAIPSKEKSEIETQRASPDWQTKLPGGRSKDGDRDTVSGDRILEHTVSVPGDFSFSEDPGLPQVLSSILKAEFRFLHFLIDSCSGYTKSNRFGLENSEIALEGPRGPWDTVSAPGT